MTRRSDVQRPAAGQLNAGGNRVDVRHTVVVTVQDSAGGVLVGLQARERSRLPLLDDLSDLGGRGVILRCPGDDATGVAPLVGARVCDLGDHAGVAAQHRDLGTAFAVVVTLLEEIANGGDGAPLAMAQKFDMH